MFCVLVFWCVNRFREGEGEEGQEEREKGEKGGEQKGGILGSYK